MRNLWVASIVWTLFASLAFAQRGHVGTQDVVWSNASGAGTAALDVRIHYPAMSSGVGAPLKPSGSPSGYGVVVFLHGYGMLGNDYGALGAEVASLGLVAVMLNTAQFSYVDMEADTFALYGAIEAASKDPLGFFKNELDIDRVGLLGHSMGGAVIAYVLQTEDDLEVGNPGYVCGLCLAPVNPFLVAAGTGTVINAPLGVVSGLGDTLTPPSAHAEMLYDAVDPQNGLKFHYQMDVACDHMNIAGLTTSSPAVFDRTRKIVCGFFGQFLTDSLCGLEEVLGVEGQSEPHLARLASDTVIPQLWAEGPLAIGQTTRLSVAAESGYAGLIAAGALSHPVTTMVGTLLLDMASAFPVVETVIVGKRLDVILTVPRAMVLVGVEVAIQGGGATLDSPFQLGSAMSFIIEI